MNELESGRLVGIARGVQRLVAPNPSMMTGPGTNTYLLGDPPTAVLDPGPADTSHLQRIQAAAPRLSHVFVTHTHPDHSPGAAALAAATGAQIVGRSPPSEAHQDESFRPTLEPARDQQFDIGGLTLRAIDTPGHASNHVCYFLEEEGMLFSGDHVLDGVTPVIMPPDGDMVAYLESLERLKTYPLRSIAPGHGRVLQDPIGVIDGIIAHRLAREAKVIAALERLSSATMDALLPQVYSDVKPQLHGWARLSLEAHLIKLGREGRCVREGDTWRVHTSKSS